MLSGCLSPDSGSLMFKGIDLIGVPTHRFVRCGIAKSFQITSVFPALSVLENVCAAVQAVDRPFDIWTRRSCLRQMEKATSILTNVGLLDKRYARADSISHGEQRSLEIAIALASDPELLLLDEPTAGMSPEETRSVISLVERIRSSRTIALVEHKMKLIMEISDRIIVLHQGEVLAVGTPATIQMDENVKRVYLGTGRGGRQ
jgi:branched-chain amino acid transport system ATP-binding protein